MITVVIHWMIKPNEASIAAFKRYWSEQAEPSNRGGLIGEFMCRPLGDEEVGFPCKEYDGSLAYRSFYTVGMWQDLETFRRIIIEPFVGKGMKQLDFEYRLRERMVLDPQAWRVGGQLLPYQDRLV